MAAWRLEAGGLPFRSRPCRFVSFGDVLSDGAWLADMIIDRALSLPPGRRVLVATDGETFGHHKKSRAAELARALELLGTTRRPGGDQLRPVPRADAARRYLRNQRPQLLELLPWRRTLAVGLRLPLEPGHQPGLARAAARGDGFRQAPRRAALRSLCGAAGCAIRWRRSRNPSGWRSMPIRRCTKIFSRRISVSTINSAIVS